MSYCSVTSTEGGCAEVIFIVTVWMLFNHHVKLYRNVKAKVVLFFYFKLKNQ